MSTTSSNRRRKAEAFVKGKKSVKAAERVALSYAEWCERHRVAAYPLSYQSLSGFVCSHVHRNRGSTRSISGVLNSLKGHGLRTGRAWIGPSDSYKLAELVRELKFRDFTECNRKRPLQLAQLLSFVKKWDLSEPAMLELAAMLLTGHNGLLRSAELLSGRKVQHVLWAPSLDEFTLYLERTKTHRQGGSLFVSYRDHEGPSAVKLLRTWFDQQQLWGKDDLHIFPPRRGSKFDFSKTLSADTFRRAIKRMVKENGLDPSHYLGHSLRAGVATDLFVGRVPYYVIKKMGRWVSDAAMIYYRDDEDVSNAVANCFSVVATGARVGGL